jgi:hypothetical protein
LVFTLPSAAGISHPGYRNSKRSHE